jgi:L-seryl-tRNA(Ser) seleniumtransferase
VSLRALPSVDRLMQMEGGRRLQAGFGRPLTLQAVRHVLETIRDAVRQGEAVPSEDEVLRRAQAAVEAWMAPSLRPVINATGVIVHTNLGRAPLSHAARQAMVDAAGYNTLEYDLIRGRRGKRDVHVEEAVCRLTGAEAAVIVNNNAAAVLLALTALARGRQVIIARSQMVEVGGGFRIPDVMRQSGAKLVEVGTTNRTHAADFEAALSDRTGLLLRAHHSNFRIIGFTTEPTLEELVKIGRTRGVPLVDDLGSGALLDTAAFGLGHEPMVQESLRAGAGVVCFSGDKLLGGPQAGIALGEKPLIDRMRRHPLARAVRPDKICLAALWATLGHYLRDEAVEHIPVWQMIAAPDGQLHARALAWRERLGLGEVVEGASTVGGGSLPEETLPTWLLRLRVPRPNAFAGRLRAWTPPIIARVEEDCVTLDPRTVLPEDEAALLAGVSSLLAHGTGSAAELRRQG